MKIDKAIAVQKKKLVAAAKAKGICENFGQNEVRKLQDNYGYCPQVHQFDNWCMNFDTSQLKEL